MISSKIRFQRFGFLLVLIVLPGLIYYFRFVRNNVEIQTEYTLIIDDFSNTTHSNFQLEKEELEYLKQFNHLFWLRDIIPNKFVFGTYDNSEKFVVPHENIIIYRMINSSNGDYVRFIGHEGLRAAYGLHAVKKHVFTREIWIPVSKSEFHWKWKQGRFLECIRLNISKGQDSPVIPDSYVDNMAIFRDFLEYYRATPFLFSGTLLGWYRECSFIKDTTDVDMAMRITSLDPVMLKHMEKSSEFKLHWILGKVNDSLEVSIYSGNIKIDLFFLYENKDSAWVGGMMVTERKKLRWFYPPIMQICTGDLLGRLFHVPCNVEEILEAEYGNWRVPHPTANFIWYKSHKNIHEAGYWSKNDWNDVYKKF